MIYLVTQYFSLNKILLQIIGLWPYQQTKLVKFQFIFLAGILAAAIIFQLTTFITSKCTPEFIIKSLSITIVFIIGLAKYVSFRIHIKTIKKLLRLLQHIFNELKEEKEIAIMKKYSWTAKCHTIILTSILVSFISALLLEQFWSTILDIVLCKNISRPHRLPIKTEYFFDQEKYFYFILFHLNAAIFIAMIATIGIGTMFIAYFQYVCGMFMIVSYRIENAMRDDLLQRVRLTENLIIIGIIRAVRIHRQAMQLCDLLIYPFDKFFLFLIVLGVLCLSLNLFQITSPKEFKNSIELLLPLLFTSISILYMFVGNYVGQNITDHNNHIYVTTYNVQWYKASLQVQKLIFFLLQRNIKNFTLSCGGLFDASFEYFATLVKTSVSYFTVIYSTR
ncbi:hypothetical protein HN011_001014 [Eciton burchellii]|nr:hypothetical protein HN011_001014 [Eciton burchellii]